MLTLYVVTVILCFHISYPAVDSRNVPDKQLKCGYEACPKIKEGYLNVHLIPHTHDDVGWLKTLDQYYFGSYSNIQRAGVQYIIDSVIQELLKDHNRRFIYVETAFFWKWWKSQHDSLRHRVKILVNSGQLEFVNGGWVMHDEAVTHYQSMIDQHTWGFRRLNDTFGECGRPRAGWQIDPFGHSRESASLMARFGYDGLFFARLDYVDHKLRMLKKRSEMVWEASPSLGTDADIFTSILYNHYNAPDGFCFDILCDDLPIIDDKHSTEYNIDRRAQDFVTVMLQQSRNYTGKNIIVPMGTDFQYQAAHVNFQSMDKLIRYVNSHEFNGTKIHLMYSTPTCYLKALNDEKLSYPTKQDDFFPYSSDPHSFWSGFYTSRPTVKYFERVGNNFLQVCKQLYALSDLGPEDQVDLNNMREAMGVLQHHDAITGTEKQHVAFDYARQLSEGFAECDIIVNAALKKLMAQSTVTNEISSKRSQKVSFDSCLLLNISQCEITEKNKKFVVTVYNPLTQPITHIVRVPVDNATYNVYNSEGAELTTQIVQIHEAVKNIPGRVSATTHELVFRTDSIPAMGFKSFYVQHVNNKSSSDHSKVNNKQHVTSYTIGDPNVASVTIDENKGTVKSVSMLGINLPVDQNFYYYKSSGGNNTEFQYRASGAYIFRPEVNSNLTLINAKPKVETFSGPVVDEIHQTYSDWVSQIIRIYKGEGTIEFNWLVGPIPVDDKVGKEVVTKYTVKDMATSGVFYTDSNGREILKRVRNHRPTYEVDLNETVSGNYYPVVTRISLNDSTTQVTIVTDRSQGGSSLVDGQIELMLHRRMLHDDCFGVDEALNETAYGTGLVARGTHYFLSGVPQTQSATDREFAQKKVLAPWTFFTATNKTLKEWKNNHKMEFSGLQEPLPSNVQILTLEPWKGKTFLIRLEHIMEKGYGDFSKPVTVNIQNVFNPFTITSVRETTLGANAFIEDVSRLVWKKESNEVDQTKDKTTSSSYSTSRFSDVPKIKLTAMQIRTFIVEVTFNG